MINRIKYRQIPNNKTLLNCNTSLQGTTLEQQLRKMIREGEPMKSTSPEIFTERKEGVLPQYDIRADKWDIAEKAMEKVNQAKIIDFHSKKEKKSDKTKNVENAAPTGTEGAEQQPTT